MHEHKTHYAHVQQQLTVIGYNILYHLHFAYMHSATVSPSKLACMNSPPTINI